MRVRVKICGITRAEDALAAVECGADAIGLVFADSPRRITPEEAAEITRSLPAFVCPVGVFVDADVDEVRRTAADAGLHAVQLAGRETPEYVRGLDGVDVIKCIHVAGSDDIARTAEYEGCDILLDTASPRAAGGTGEVFPWEFAVELAARRRIILAGGLRPDNVADAVRRVRPWAVDVSSGVESRPGIKDAGKIRRFVENAGSADDGQTQG